jgi:hypothetical protein
MTQLMIVILGIAVATTGLTGMLSLTLLKKKSFAPAKLSMKSEMK